MNPIEQSESRETETTKTEENHEVMIAIEKLWIDDEVQPRTAAYDSIVAEYAKAMEGGAKFPPIIVFEDESERMILADGFLRVRAAEKLGIKEMEAEVRQGGRADAILHAVKANSTHGVRINSADKRRAFEKLL